MPLTSSESTVCPATAGFRQVNECRHASRCCLSAAAYSERNRGCWSQLPHTGRWRRRSPGRADSASLRGSRDGGLRGALLGTQLALLIIEPSHVHMRRYHEHGCKRHIKASGSNPCNRRNWPRYRLALRTEGNRNGRPSYCREPAVLPDRFGRNRCKQR